MSESGVIPPPEERKPFTVTGEMYDTRSRPIVFGHQGSAVILVAGDRIELRLTDQDLFARNLFRAMTAAEDDLSEIEVPF